MTVTTRCRKHVAPQLLVMLLLSASVAQAGNVGVDLNIHMGDQPRTVVVREPVYQPPAPNVVVVEDDVNFLYPEDLGFYVAVGVPYDLFYVGTSYYLYRDGRWLRAPSSRGPWVVQRYRELPPPLRHYRIDRIREIRNREYVVYRRDHDHYRGRHFRSPKEEWKEHRRAEKEYRKEERREEKERWKEEKHHGRGHGDRD